uniref:Glycosyltransferase n=1 Tax=Leersia perrieri TaxID=77586 RepID=A0A0D9V8B4_9ORYZ
MKPKTIVLYPGLYVSHFVPMMQLADAILDHGYAVAVALIDVTMDDDPTFAAAVRRGIATAAKAKPSITFHKLPRIKNPPALTSIVGYLETVRRYNDHLREFLLRSGARSGVHAVVVDAPSVVEALDVVTRELGIPAYSFFASNASALAVFLHLPWIRVEGDATLDIAGVPPMPASHLMPEMLEDPESETYAATTRMIRATLDADGVLVNTFASLESRAVRALGDPRFLPRAAHREMPPVYCVGPLVVLGKEDDDERKENCSARHECLVWLDEQPDRSVVFLCFGGTGAVTHTPEQITEIAVGLENSGHRFLWVLRPPRGGNDDDMVALLPHGFLVRTSGRGLVVRPWAPQAEALRHRATGAFVTHCGWNSALEAIVSRVPMLCWPMYAEQGMNKVVMVEEIGVGVEVAGWKWRREEEGGNGVVMADEVEGKIRLVMESEEGERLRSSVAAHGDAAAVAWKDGGSSRAALSLLLSDVDARGLD